MLSLEIELYLKKKIDFVRIKHTYNWTINMRVVIRNIIHQLQNYKIQLGIIRPKTITSTRNSSHTY